MTATDHRRPGSPTDAFVAPSGPVAASSPGPEPAAPPGSGPVATLGLGAAMAASNVLGYVFLALLSRALGPEDFGSFSALNNAGLLLAIPAGALQVVIARHQQLHDGITGLRLAMLLGGSLAGAGVLISPLLSHLLHLGSVLPVVLVMGALLPMALTATFQGILLGQGRIAALSAVYLATAVGRVAVGGVTLVWHLSLVAGLTLLVVAAVATAAFAALLTRGELRVRHRGVETHLLGELWRSNRTLAALVALSSIDVLLARHFLDAGEAGRYALASLFAKALFWGTQFIALALVPAVQGPGARRRTLGASALILVLGLTGTAVVVLLAEPLLGLTGGTAYAAATGLLAPFTLLGTVLALAQVLLFADMARDRTRLGWVAWGACTVQVALTVWRHESAVHVLQAALVGAGLVAGVGLVRVLRRPVRQP